MLIANTNNSPLKLIATSNTGVVCLQANTNTNPVRLEALKVGLYQSPKNYLYEAYLEGGGTLSEQDFITQILSSSVNTVTKVIGSTLPASITAGTTTFIFGFSSMTADIDLTSYTPTGLGVGAIARFKKLDTSIFKIGFTDDGVDYSFVDQRGEYMELIWDGLKFVI